MSAISLRSDMPEKGEITITTQAARNSNSVIITFAMSSVQQSGWKEGDQIRWELRAEEPLDFAIVVKPIVVNRSG